MKTRGKNYLKWKEKNISKKNWTISEVLDILIKEKLEKFNSSLNVTFHLNLKEKKNEHNLKGFYTLPFSKEKKIKIIVFTKDFSSNVLPNEVYKIGGIDLINEINFTKKINTDVVIATPEIMPDLGKIAKILGPKKLMPSIKNGTVTKDLKTIINEYKKGKTLFYTDGLKCIHFVFGSIKDSKEKLQENFKYIFDLINKIRPKNIKGKYIKGIHVSTTMSPNFKIQLS